MAQFEDMSVRLNLTESRFTNTVAAMSCERYSDSSRRLAFDLHPIKLWTERTQSDIRFLWETFPGTSSSRVPVIRSIPSIFTAMAVLPHAVLGCCWHHAHAEVEHATPAVEVAGVERPDDVSHHHGHRHTSRSTDSHVADETGGHDDHQCPHEPCDEPSCAFVSVAKSNLQLEATMALWQSASSDATAEFAPARHSTPSPPIDLSTSAPLRAQTQVWLL